MSGGKWKYIVVHTSYTKEAFEALEEIRNMYMGNVKYSLPFHVDHILNKK